MSDPSSLTVGDTLERPYLTRRALERYLNEGSPSGFTGRYDVAPQYAPSGLADHFLLPLVEVGCSERAWYNGPRFSEVVPSAHIDAGSQTDLLPVHPEQLEAARGLGGGYDVAHEVRVAPTASARTVELLEDPRWHFKLHYPGIIGRIDRSLPWRKAVAGPEVSLMLKQATETDARLAGFLFLPEVSVLALPPSEFPGQDVCAVARDSRPYGADSSNVRTMLPAFSLLAAAGQSLLAELIERAGNVESFVEVAGLATVDWYFLLALEYGLLPEINAQNLLLAVDNSGTPMGFVLRDLMGVEKDAAVRSMRGLENSFRSDDYKLLEAEDEYARLRRSFSFDFKLSTYVLGPLCEAIARIHGHQAGAISRELIHARVEHWLGQAPLNYLPSGGWYRHDPVLLTGRREYVLDGSAPLFRNLK